MDPAPPSAPSPTRLDDDARAAHDAHHPERPAADAVEVKPHHPTADSDVDTDAGSDADRLAHEPPTTCLNCGAVLPGRFCPDCGQKDQPIRQPAHVFITESVSEYFGLDGRLWRSLGALLFRPGALTEAYLDGRRTHYLRPLRLYLSATVLFFFLLSFKDPFAIEERTITYAPIPADSALTPDDLSERLETREEAAEATAEAIHSASANLLGLVYRDPLAAEADSAEALAALLDAEGDRVDEVEDAAPDTLLSLADLDPRAAAALSESGSISTSEIGTTIASGLEESVPEWMKGDLARRMEESESPAERRLLMAQYQQAILRQIPTALFLVLPVFALLLKLFYVGGGGRAPRLRRRPSALPADASWGQRLRHAIARARWRLRQVSNRVRFWRRRRKLRLARERRIRGAARRLAGQIRSSGPLKPWRVRRLRLLRRSVNGWRKRYYAEHLVFALHVHAFTFLVLIPLLYVGLSDGDYEWAARLAVFAATVGVPVYFLIAQHRVYRESWLRTLGKASVLGFAYLVVIALGTLAAAGLALRLG